MALGPGQGSREYSDGRPSLWVAHVSVHSVSRGTNCPFISHCFFKVCFQYIIKGLGCLSFRCLRCHANLLRVQHLFGLLCALWDLGNRHRHEAHAASIKSFNPEGSCLLLAAQNWQVHLSPCKLTESQILCTLDGLSGRGGS